MLLKWIYLIRHFGWLFWHVLLYVDKLPGRFEIQTTRNQLNSNNLIINISTHTFFLFQLVRVLVSPDNPQQATATCQKIMNQCGECRSTACLKLPSIGKMFCTMQIYCIVTVRVMNKYSATTSVVLSVPISYWSG